MVKILSVISQKIIEYSFYALLFLIPLVLTPFNYELFEYNKMMLTYGITVIIVGAWLTKIIIFKKINIKRTPLDIPLLLFLASQIISTIFSIDRHVSIWGYYSRFNGGLLSTISYFLLYYAFVSNFPQDKIRKLLKIALFSGLLVAIYGILEHLGIDKNIWVQDVQNRVFSTLGQPNWLAAYIAILIPLSLGLGLNNISRLVSISEDKIQNSKFKIQNQGINIFSFKLLVYWVIGIILYATLLFTKSRSGFLGFWISLIICSIFAIFQSFQNPARADIWKKTLKYIGFNIFILIVITFIFGAPFDQINRLTLPYLTINQPTSPTGEQLPTNNLPAKPTGGSVIEVGITESGTIRRIVWKGAIDIFRHNPLFGTGVETFAFSYYKYRPVEHNITSEWDFLYNKAHNEYLNYAATTGIFGLGSYLLIILVFIGWNLSELKTQNSNVKTTSHNLKSLRYNIFDLDLRFDILHLSLFASWLSILITNFFGFSVVLIQLFFFLIPAICFINSSGIISQSGKRSDSRITPNLKDSGLARITNADINLVQYILIIGLSSVICYLLFFLSRLWYADVLFASGYHSARAQDIALAYQTIKKALEINDEEPFYYDEFSFPAAELAVAFADEKQASLSASLINEAIIASNYAISKSPRNVNFWKTRTRVYYALSQLDEKYFNSALVSLEQAKKLAPTDPKVRYNLALMYDRVKRKKESFDELIETTKLKPDYRDAFFALAYLYEKDNKRDKAKEALQYILSKIATDDAEARKKLNELK